MNLELLSLVATLMPSHISAEQIQTCDFKDLGMDSMVFLQLFSLIETEYGIEISDDDLSLENFGTLSGLSAYIAAKAASSATEG